VRYNLSWLSHTTPNYRRLFYFTKADKWLKINLQARQLKISQFSKCDDLFDLASYSLENQDIRKKQKQWVEQIESQRGLICFPSTWRHPLMWAHYTDHGKGVCLVFDVIMSDLQEATYLPKRAKNCGQFPNPRDHCFREFCSTKANYWFYENEVRLFVDLQNNKSVTPDNTSSSSRINFLKFGSTVRHVGIINGPRSKIERQELLSICSGDIEYLQSRAAFTKFSIVSQRPIKIAGTKRLG